MSLLSGAAVGARMTAPRGSPGREAMSPPLSSTRIASRTEERPTSNRVTNSRSPGSLSPALELTAEYGLFNVIDDRLERAFSAGRSWYSIDHGLSPLAGAGLLLSF